MKVGVGSKNKTKVNAVEDALKDYPMFDAVEVIGVPVQVEEFGHPKDIDETVAGAIDRAKQAWEVMTMDSVLKADSSRSRIQDWLYGSRSLRHF